MKDDRQADQALLFSEASLERHMPAEQMPRAIDRIVDLSKARAFGIFL